MRQIGIFLSRVLLFSIFSFSLLSCYNTPTFPSEPEISFNNITFNRGASELDPDSLVITMNFRDGDGDLGLESEGADTRDPYNDLWYFRKSNGEPVTLADRQLPGYDTLLPPFEFPYYCTNWSIIEEDTFYVEPNEYHHNIKIKYFVRKNGEYTEFDFETVFDPLCGETFDGRFPLLNDPSRNRPLEGTLKYKMQSAGFELLFRQDTLMLEIFIYDRALNRSNIINTPDFVLKDITIGG